MRYRRLDYRYQLVVRSHALRPFGDVWQADRLRLLVQGRWRPDADCYETAASVEVLVDLAGVGEDEYEIQLFEDVLVVEGERRLPPCPEAALYHAAGVRQGPFRVELPLPAPVDGERAQARYDRGLLHVSLPKRRDAR
jgi:HSP20 family molecular chaperone IbpA